MTEREQLLQEIEQIPDILVREVLNFLLFVKTKAHWTVKQVEKKPDLETPSFLNFIEQMDTSLPIDSEEVLPSDFAQNLDHYLYGCSKE
jgi:hypothetical protein